MRTTWCVTIALALAPAAFAARTALPGTVNYIEGQVSVNGQPLAASQNGSNALTAEQTISVGQGKAEVLLSPGSFLRLGNNSQVRMISPTLSDPRVEVLHG